MLGWIKFSGCFGYSEPMQRRGTRIPQHQWRKPPIYCINIQYRTLMRMMTIWRTGGTNVAELAKITSNDEASTVEALQAITALCVQGKLRGIVIGFETTDTCFEVAMLGRFRRNPIEALGLCTRMTLTANRLVTLDQQERANQDIKRKKGEL